MASNKFFTIMVVPEKTQQVRRIVIPSYLFKGAVLASVFLVVLAVLMVLDYANVMKQISEHRQLQVENRQLKQSVQIFKDKMITIENTLDRVKTFATKLKIITNIEDSSSMPGTGSPLNQMLNPGTAPLSSPTLPKDAIPSQEKSGQNGVSPDHSNSAHLQHTSLSSLTNRGISSVATTPDTDSFAAGEEHDIDVEITPSDTAALDEASRIRRKTLLSALTSTNEALGIANETGGNAIKAEFQKLNTAYDEVLKFALAEEQEVQFIMEKLGEKKVLLASTPTLLPTRGGYISSGYGVRISPYDGRRKMHEGIDIANRYGSDIFAPADGYVKMAASKPGYGKIVVLDHGNGIETVYAHNSGFYVREGDKVRRGTRIASVGNTGHSTGPHCHYEVRAGGLPVDPCWYILDSIDDVRSGKACGHVSYTPY
jgi:murein DD-endopeptidase MepM/ murein hydrolase activator NlpD